MPFSCAASSASAICLAYSRAVARGERTSKSVARHELHHQRAVFDAVDLRDVGVVQRGEHFGFARKAGEPVGVLCQGVGKYLDRDRALQLGVCRAIHVPHPAGAERRDDFIGPESVTSGEGHAWSHAESTGLEELDGTRRRVTTKT